MYKIAYSFSQSILPSLVDLQSLKKKQQLIIIQITLNLQPLSRLNQQTSQIIHKLNQYLEQQQRFLLISTHFLQAVFIYSIEFQWKSLGETFKQEKRKNHLQSISFSHQTMNTQLQYQEFTIKRESNDQMIAQNVDNNPESEIDLELMLGGIWKTNLLIEGEQEKHNQRVLLCKITSIEDNIQDDFITIKP